MDEFRHNKIKEEMKEAKKFYKLIKKTNCAIYSIQEIECFLHNLTKASKCFWLYKFLK